MEGPIRLTKHLNKNGDVKIESYTNRCDIVMMRNTHRLFSQDSRSYHSAIKTYTDHRLVKAKLNLIWYKKMSSKTPKSIDEDESLNEVIMRLSKNRDDINSMKDIEKKREMKIKRKKIAREIDEKLAHVEEEEVKDIRKLADEVERDKDHR